MSTHQRVFITGRSAVTASGETSDATWDAICQGTTGIAEITQWDLSSFPSRLGGELKNYQPGKMLPDRKLVKVISRQDVIGINAAVQAVEHSQMIAYRDGLADPADFNEQTAVYVGSPGNKYFQQYDFLPLMSKSKDDMQAFAKQLFDEVHPMWLLRILPNNVLAYTGITYGFKGPNHNVTNHAVGGMQALIEAFHAIQMGQADRAVVVGYDMGVEPQALFYYDKLGVISAKHLKPFDAAHDGTILAEGAAALVLESEASAKARNATCYAEVLFGQSATEGQGLFSLQADGQPLAELINSTLSRANCSAQDVSCVIAHGNGNKNSDESEALALSQVFSSQSVPVTAFKWSVGHTVSASGILDAVMASYVLDTQCLPGIANLETPDASATALSLSQTHQSIGDNATALVVNRGFASLNACLVMKACE